MSTFGLVSPHWTAGAGPGSSDWNTMFAASCPLGNVPTAVELPLSVMKSMSEAKFPNHPPQAGDVRLLFVADDVLRARDGGAEPVRNGDVVRSGGGWQRERDANHEHDDRTPAHVRFRTTRLTGPARLHENRADGRASARSRR